MKALFFLMLMVSSLVNAQTRTEYKDLSDRAHVPLYDCSIFENQRDRTKCNDLKTGEYIRFENSGYAINCYDLSRSRQYMCLRFADEVLFNASSMINCDYIRDAVSARQCQITKLGYLEGRFSDRGSDRGSDRRYDNNNRGGSYSTSSSTTTTSSTVITNEPVYTSTTTCDVSSYDRALNGWRIRKEEQRKKGQTRAAVGVLTTIGGIILSGSNNRTTRTIGQGLTIGGVFLTTWGLVEMIDADMTYPHMDPYCKTTWVQEQRMVVIEEQQCVTTRYSENNRYSSRYYYEVNCSNKRYVTFEEFRPWNEGRAVSNYRY
jgi:hypothetical protein